MSREIREAYDREVRARPQTEDPRYRVEWDGPVYRMVGPKTDVPNSAVLLTRLDARTAPAAIERQLDYFRALGQGFEWKLYDYDEPADLAERLADAGFVAQDSETLVVRDASAAFAMPSPADGVVIHPQRRQTKFLGAYRPSAIRVVFRQQSRHRGCRRWIAPSTPKGADGGGSYSAEHVEKALVC